MSQGSADDDGDCGDGDCDDREDCDDGTHHVLDSLLKDPIT